MRMQLNPSGPGAGQMGEEEERHATWVELFFDLVFVLAVTQVADTLGHNLSPAGFLHFGLVFLPLWWGWVGFSFYVTRFPHDDYLVRALMLAAMLAVVALSTNIGGAFTGETAVGFALSYAALRACLVGLYAHTRWREPAARELVDFYVAGFGLGVVLWVVSATVPEPARYALWAAGFLVEAATPALAGERLRRGPAINCSHLPERFGLFVIIVLGESVTAVGLGLSDIQGSTTLIAVACFVLAAALWWDYFVFGYWSARRGLLSSVRRGAYARDVYGYAHFPVVVGIAAASVGAEQAIAHSGDAGLAPGARWALAGGLGLYLLGLAAMHLATARAGGDPAPRGALATVALTLALAAGGGGFAPLLFVTLAVLIVVGQLALEAKLKAEVMFVSDGHEPSTESKTIKLVKRN